MKINADDINYKIKTATDHEIFIHLTECSDAFVPTLAERVNISEYTRKIFKKSVTFEAWAGQLFIGCLAAYFNNSADGSAFITNVSVLPRFTGMGIASRLLEMCIGYARENNFIELRLKVDKLNNPAISLYHKFGFENYETQNNIVSMRKRIQ